MDITTQRRFLGAIAGGLFVGTTAAIVWSFAGIDNSSPISESRPMQEFRPAIATDQNDPRSDDRIVAQRLRGPLYDPPAPPPARPPEPPSPAATPAARPKPKLDVTLVGTIIEAKQSLAILADSTGKFDIKGIGESLELSTEGITVQNIESEQVILQYQGRRSTVTLDRSKKKAGDGGNREKKRRRDKR
jgi:type II secretory pathway component PulC